MKSRFAILAIAFATLTAFWATAQAPDPVPCCGQQFVQVDGKKKHKHHRGHKPMSAELRALYHAKAAARHDDRVKRLPKATTPTFDCRTTFGNVLPTDDQASCGDCFGVSSADGCSMALIKAGQLPLDPVKGRLSSQYGLDYTDAFQGGCNGGDEAQVIDYIKTTGFPLTSDYGPYTASAGRPKPVTNMKLWKIADWGYCTPAQQSGIASTQDIKNCMVQYGPISVAFDASGCDSYQWPGVMSGRGNSVDHAVLCIGWDDSKGNGGCFLGMNQWGDSWGGPNGTFWIEYGAYSWGTEAIWMTASTPPTPPGPGPGPGPQPPWIFSSHRGAFETLQGIRDMIDADAAATLLKVQRKLNQQKAAK